MTMNAFEIVGLLLEADQPSHSGGQVSAGDPTGVYVFGPELPKEGYAVPDIETAVQDFRRYGIIPQDEDSATMLDELVNLGYAFLLKKSPDEVEVISQALPVQTTPEGAERASQFLGLERKSRVQYRKTPRSSSKQLDVDYVLHGSKEMAQRQKEQRSVQTKQLGTIDPEEEGFQAPAHGVGYKDPQEMMPLDAPAEIGVTFAMDAKDGIHVQEVHPQGPAAQAGVRAGDVIVAAGKFARRDQKEPKAYTLATPKHLEFILRIADLAYPVPFRVIRGDGEMWIPVQPQPRKTPQQTEVIPAAEVQASAGSRKNSETAPPEQTRSQPSPPAGRAKQMIMNIRQPQKGPRQRRLPLKYAPNEPSPARETGNPPANVSSLS